MTTRYPVGQRVRIDAEFSNAAGAVDPDSVRFRVRFASGATTEHTYGVGTAIARIAAGHYRTHVLVTEAGVVSYRFWSEGDHAAAVVQTIIVEPDPTEA